KDPVALGAVVGEVTAALEADQQALYDDALSRRESNTTDVTNVEDAVAAAATGWARIPWATLGEEGEATLAEQSVSVRCLTRPDGSVPDAGDEPDLLAWVGRAY
ncbi:MAG: proline--tRNA ligase, partial [Mycobacterium sp.]|nr:proline--tRNA ligase [Mycobacterium sp.]